MIYFCNPSTAFFASIWSRLVCNWISCRLESIPFKYVAAIWSSFGWYSNPWLCGYQGRCLQHRTQPQNLPKSDGKLKTNCHRFHEGTVMWKMKFFRFRTLLPFLLQIWYSSILTRLYKRSMLKFWITLHVARDKHLENNIFVFKRR